MMIKRPKHNDQLTTNQDMGLMKVFSGNEALALALQEKIEAAGINTVVRANNQSDVSSSAVSKKPLELFIQEVDFGKAHPIIESFRTSL